MSIINDVLVNKLFKDPPKRTKEIPLLSEKTASGDGMVFINDAYSDFPIKNLTLQGNTKQDSTTGTQLFDISSATIGAVSRTTGENLEYGENWKRSDYIQVVSGQQYSCTYVVNYQDTGFAFYDEQKTFLSGIPCTKNFTVPESAIFCRITVNTTDGNPNIFMFNAGSTALPWEPYTGGKPSPSPDYPQEIKNVGKWNEETQKYEVDVRVTGKNIVNIPDFGVNTPDTAIKCYISKNICISAQEKADVSKSVWRFKALHKDGSLEYITDATLPGCFYATKENPIVSITYRGIYVTREYKGIMVEYGTVATEYEPYKEQTIKITSDRPITKWDKLVEQDGQIGWLYGSRRYILTGNEVFESRDGYNIESYTNRFFILNDLLMENDALKPLAYMKCLRHKQYVYAPNIFEEGFETNKGQFHIKFLNERVGISTSDDNEVRTLKYSEYVKKMYKDGNPIEILYATKNKEFVPLPQSEQDVIRALLTYYPTTVVTVDGGELPVGIEVTYMHPEYIPTKQSALRMWFKENPII